MDDVDEYDGGGVWMTYGELAAARGIKRGAAIRLVQRHRWRKREGSNDGFAHVLVPPDWAKPGERATPHDVAPRRSAPSSQDIAHVVQTAVQAVTAAKDAEIQVWRERTQEAEGARHQAEARADRADQALTAERNRADALRERMDQSQAAREAAEKALAAFQQSDAARRALGRLARLRAAWRGE